MLHIVKGRAGSGKTAWLRERIKESIDSDKRPLLLVPDQFSFENERAMLSLLGAKNMKKIDVYSFPRLAVSNIDSKILQGKMFADDGVRMAYMSEAITQLSGELHVFSKIRHNVSGLESFIDLNKEFETCAITDEVITETLVNMPEGLLKDKLYEINLINEAYNALLHRSYFDDTECLKYFNDFALENAFFKDRVLFLDSFKAFSAQELNCIYIALSQAEDVYITICADENRCEESPFIFMNSLEDKIKTLAKKCGTEIKLEKFLKNDNAFSESIQHVEKNIYSEEVVPQKSDGSVTIFECEDITDECNTVALEIKKLIRDGGYRCRDIAVVERSSDKYKRLLCDALKRYDVPVFDDSRRPLTFETLFVCITSVIEAVADGFKTEAILRYLKTGLSPLSFKDIAKLEKYALVWDINGNAWKNDFTMHPKGFGEELNQSAKDEIEYLNNLRKKVVLPLLKLKKNCDGASGEDIAKFVYEFLIEVKVDDKLYELATELNAQGFPVEALQKEQSWNALIELLDTIAEITKGKFYTIKRWFELFMILVLSKDIGEIPQGLDEVKIGSADRIRTENVKVVFLVGVNKNEFPRVSTVGGLLTDGDRRILTKMSLEIRPPFEENVAEERFIAYCMLTAGKERLYLSYREFSDDESTSGASEIIESIKEMLPDVKAVASKEIPKEEKIESDQSAFYTLAEIYNENTELRNTLFEHFKCKPEYFGRLMSMEYAKNGKKGVFNDSSVSEKLFGSDIKLSASKLESFYKCSFSYFCNYGLDVRAIKKAELNPADSGKIIHGALETVLKKYDGKIDDFLGSSDDELKEIISEYLKKFLEEKMGGFDDKSKRFMFLYNRSIDVLMMIFDRLKNEFSVKGFTPIAYELEIGANSDDDTDKVPCYELQLDEKRKISVKGSIDRVDLLEKDGVHYIRVVDYKTGKKEFKLAELLSGINLQMVLYLMALLKNGKGVYKDAVPAGVLYLPSRIGISNYLKSRNPSSESVDAQKRISGKLSGMVLKSPVVMNAMGADDEGFKECLPVKYKVVAKDKDGNKIPPETKIVGNYYSQENFRELSNIVDEKIIEMGKTLHKGEFLTLPTGENNYSLPCKYCDYRSICGFENGDDYRKPEKYSHEEVLKMLSGDCDEKRMDE